MPDQAEEGDLDIQIQTAINDPIAIGLAENLCGKQEYLSSLWIETLRHGRRVEPSWAGGTFAWQGNSKPKLVRSCIL
jgi:hypothetical protein